MYQKKNLEKDIDQTSRTGRHNLETKRNIQKVLCQDREKRTTTTQGKPRSSHRYELNREQWYALRNQTKAARRRAWRRDEMEHELGVHGVWNFTGSHVSW
jgi:hypothetical protein